jgi:hypothetical protein
MLRLANLTTKYLELPGADYGDLVGALMDAIGESTSAMLYALLLLEELINEAQREDLRDRNLGSSSNLDTEL